MTPHDELMALAGKWRDISHTHKIKADADNCAYPLSELRSLQFQAAEAATDFDALLDSDAFRAIVRDAGRWAFVRDHWHNLCTATGVVNEAGDYGVTQVFIGVGEHEPYAAGSLDAAIDAAASGATSEDGRNE